METSKFSMLCSAYDKAQHDFNEYNNRCHAFALSVVAELKVYFDVPDRQFTLYRIAEDNDFALIHGSLLGALTLTPESLWHFGFGITVCQAPEAYPEELILVQILFRKDGEDSFFLKHTYGDKEFKVQFKKPETYTSYFDDLFSTIISSYDSQLQQFIGQKTTRKLGYKQ